MAFRFLGWVVATLLLLVSTVVTLQVVQAGELALPKDLTTELNEVLHASEGLHKALVLQDEEKTEIAVREMIQRLEIARKYSHLVKPYERGHIVRILDAAKDNFELTQSLYGDERRTQMEEGFNQLVNLVRIYRLQPSFGIFFCPKDRTSWVQRWPAQAQNPFRPDSLKDCGIRASR
jgi:hypothetical protein